MSEPTVRERMDLMAGDLVEWFDADGVSHYRYHDSGVVCIRTGAEFQAWSGDPTAKFEGDSTI